MAREESREGKMKDEEAESVYVACECLDSDFFGGDSVLRDLHSLNGVWI